MEGIIPITTQLALQTYTANDLEHDKASFLANLRATGRRETTVATYDMALRSVYRTIVSEGSVIDPRHPPPTTSSTSGRS